jgi:hypothetical protein
VTHETVLTTESPAVVTRETALATESPALTKIEHG